MEEEPGWAGTSTQPLCGLGLLCWRRQEDHSGHQCHKGHQTPLQLSTQDAIAPATQTPTKHKPWKSTARNTQRQIVTSTDTTTTHTRFPRHAGTPLTW